MVVAHSHPPNYTGDHGHLKNNNRDETVTCLSASPLNKRGQTQKLGKCSKTSYTFPWNNKPVAPHRHSLTSSKPATQKEEGTTPRPRLLSTQNSLATRVSTLCQEPKSERVYLG
ncbi:hypothetical protein E2C01_094374 [Portunus trituberculatus]|uniref:Uncharacterized protein n=1 Tax=Portunus trituberculatus TaxID=210409 RepID=A0A5B7JSA0_PORTR|nr:hypothetical protein [Portunus trituberculatus]